MFHELVVEASVSICLDQSDRQNGGSGKGSTRNPSEEKRSWQGQGFLIIREAVKNGSGGTTLARMCFSTTSGSANRVWLILKCPVFRGRVHTKVPMRSYIGSMIKRAHVSHHLKDQRYWLSFTCPPIDVLMGTTPEGGQGVTPVT